MKAISNASRGRSEGAGCSVSKRKARKGFLNLYFFQSLKAADHPPTPTPYPESGHTMALEPPIPGDLPIAQVAPGCDIWDIAARGGGGGGERQRPLFPQHPS